MMGQFELQSLHPCWAVFCLLVYDQIILCIKQLLKAEVMMAETWSAYILETHHNLNKIFELNIAA